MLDVFKVKPLRPDGDDLETHTEGERMLMLELPGGPKWDKREASMDVVKQDMKLVGVVEDVAGHHVRWEAGDGL